MSTLINKKSYAHVQHRVSVYEIITSCFARNHNLQCMKIRPCMITGLMNLQISKWSSCCTNWYQWHQKSRHSFILFFKIAFYNLILGLSWMKQNKVILNADRALSYNWIHRNYYMKQRSFCWEWVQSCYDVSYILYKPYTKERRETEEDWGVSQHDLILKSLNLTEEDWLRTILSDHYHEF
jgi:hypothetical protein